MTETEELVKIFIDLPDNEVAGGEGLWAKPVGPDRYEIRNVPFHAYDLHFNDVVRASPDAPDQKPRIRAVVKRSGHKTLRVVFPKGTSEATQVQLLDQLRTFGVTYESQPQVASEIEALERAWSAAFLKHDTATIGSILADDYVGIDGRGVVSDKAHEIEEAKAPAAGVPPGTYLVLGEALSGVRVRLYGDAAVLTAINTARISDRGEETTVRYRRTTVYVRRNGKWQCVSFHGSRIIDQKHG